MLPLIKKSQSNLLHLHNTTFGKYIPITKHFFQHHAVLASKFHHPSAKNELVVEVEVLPVVEECRYVEVPCVVVSALLVELLCMCFLVGSVRSWVWVCAVASRS